MEEYLEEKRLTVSGLNRWTRTRSRRGTTALMDLNVAWAAYGFIVSIVDLELPEYCILTIRKK